MEIDSDELGEKGESHFKEICADARLICNKSGRDRAGWDFIIELRYGEQEDLDARPLPVSAHLQLKTVQTSTDVVSLRLSSAERLAKDPKPSFIYVFKVNDDLSYHSAYILHLAGDPLARILKRLREERRDGDRPPINQQKITFQIASMTMLPPTGAALRDALMSFCPDMSRYVAHKRDHLAELGYGELPFSAQTTLQVDSMEDLADGLLGLKDIPVVRFMPSETRFGIKLPLKDQEAKGGTLRVSPVPMDYCTISARESATAPPAVFRAPVYTTSRLLPRESAKMLIQPKLFEFHSTATSQRFSFQEERVIAADCTIKEWVDLLRFQVMLFSETGTITIAPNRGKSIKLPLKFRETINSKPYEGALDVFRRAQEIFEIAGISDRAFKFNDIGASHAIIRVVSNFIRGSDITGVLTFDSNKLDPAALPATAPALYINRMVIADIPFGLCARVNVAAADEGKAIHWRSYDGSLVCIAPLENGDTYEDFCGRLKQDYPMEIAMVGAMESDAEDRETSV